MYFVVRMNQNQNQQTERASLLQGGEIGTAACNEGGGGISANSVHQSTAVHLPTVVAPSRPGPPAALMCHCNYPGVGNFKRGPRPYRGSGKVKASNLSGAQVCRDVQVA